MAILTQWDNRNKTAILLEFESQWSWSDLEDALQAADELIISVPHQVDIIIDMEGSSIPKDFINAVKKLIAENGNDARNNEGHRIVVGANKAMRTVYNTVQSTFKNQLDGRKLLFASDLTDARAILRSLRM
ncbi:hypothetical protein G4Y79_10500 [Phototrophicus methaneseepsis]|uniref:Uncharacterized protein n=1 Tax=Phototrophicus methaneseepsis TaxID=2710758 RepID=A0A7S8IGJ9_9CHLR|nr:hypothetical protein [Phototrophicus methaneseepsis]QPC84777.1 hypothetical protein G4Y79_10500 [Phototrophicus methaneseepsis]